MKMRWWLRQPAGRWGDLAREPLVVPRRKPGPRTAAEMDPGFRRGTAYFKRL
jgi:hypothetical protein